ncbi:MAG: right-handed parallel beta-helix repeat-containing protein [Candidatus Coatesbacteria bacterium]|nr:right-handed parallel beta-helix repeat-containing protein [Candidatus Coatesbacteria bacterium]
MSKIRVALMFVITVSFICGIALGADYYVDGVNGSNSNGGRFSDDAWLNIGYALSRVRGTSSNPANIYIAAGTYSETANGEPYPITMESYTSLIGAGADSTILDAEGEAYPVVSCMSLDDAALSNLMLRGGKADVIRSQGTGGGVMSSGCNSLMIDACIISENSAVMGAGLYLMESSGTLRDCQVIRNTVDAATEDDGYCSGGGISWINCSLTIDGCVIAENTALGRGDGGGMGAGIYGAAYTYGHRAFTDVLGRGMAESKYETVIRDCVISDNSSGGDISASGMGGGVCVGDDSPSFRNCLFMGNYASICGGALLFGAYDGECSPEILNCTLTKNDAGYNTGGAICSMDATPVVQNCIIWGAGDTIDEMGGGVSLSYCCTQSDYWGAGNISEDPLFETGPLGDYYLDPDSPCIDAGSQSAADAGLTNHTTQADGTPDTGVVDMGYHYPLGSDEVPTIDCWLNASEFAAGEQLIGMYQISNSGSDITVDVYFAFVMPDGKILCISPTLIDFGIFPCITGLLLEQGYLMSPETLLDIFVPGGLPAGGYLFAGALSTPGQFEVIGEISLYSLSLH